MNEHVKTAAKIIRDIQYATVATVTPSGEPWNSPVYCVKDADLNMYWFSDKENQHSINVLSHSNAFIVFYDSTASIGTGDGVYIQAVVSELSDPNEIIRVRRIYKGENYEANANEFLGDAVRRVYCAKPLRVWVNDYEAKEGRLVRDYRVELDIEALRDEVNSI